MPIDLTGLLLALPIAFALGWLAARLDWRQMRVQVRRMNQEYFQGLSYLLNNQQDRAVDAFIETIQNNPDTTELHFALGQLFRRRGEYDRAVRVHQHLLLRADLQKIERERAQYALAQDYLKAGLIDRAEESLLGLKHTADAVLVLMDLLGLYERSRDWVRSHDITLQLQALGQGSFANRQAHYLCEQVQVLLQADAPEHGRIQALLAQALACAPQSARSRLMAIEHGLQQSQAEGAWQGLVQLLALQPEALPLSAALWLRCAQALGRQAEAAQILAAAQEQSPSLDVLFVLVALQAERADEWYAQYLQRESSLVAAADCLQPLLQHSASPLKATLQKVLKQAVAPRLRYRCAACGFEAQRHFWQCLGCQTWDSYPYRRIEEL